MPLTNMHVASFASQSSAGLVVCLLCIQGRQPPCVSYLDAWFCSLHFLNAIVTICNTLPNVNSVTAFQSLLGWCVLLLARRLVVNAMNVTMAAEVAMQL